MRFEAVAFDLDDTLLRDDLTISDRTIAAMRAAAARGIRVIPASGRARDSMWPFVDILGCASCCIACNGAEVWSADGRLLHRVTFPEADALAIAAFGDRHGVYYQTYAGAHFYFNHDSDYARAYAASSLLTGRLEPDLPAFLRANPTSKILMMDDPARIAAMLEEARSLFAGRAAVTCSKPWFLEFNPPAATKGNALQFCAERLSFSRAGCLAFGDSLNDLSMLDWAGCGVAVGNARPDVKAQVAYVCGRSMEDGPAAFTERHVLHGEPLPPAHPGGEGEP